MERFVVFDFHETLVQLTPSTDATLAEIVGVPEDRCRAVFACVDGQVDELRATGAWPTSPAERWPVLYGLILEALELPGDGAEVAAAMGQRFADPASYVTFPEAPETLRALRDAGARIGILSNTDMHLWPLLEGLGLDGLVDAAIPCYLRGVEKPEPAAFAMAIDELGAAPDRTWFVGDSLHHDVLPAADAGLSPVLVDRLDMHPPSSRYAKVSSLAPVPELVMERPQ